MNTANDLKEEFGTRFPTLDQVAEKYLGLEHQQVLQRVASGQLPFECFKIVKSQKAPWLVDVVKLAKYIDDVANK